MSKPLVFWLVVATMLISMIVQVYRGSTGTVRQYGVGDVFGAIIEIPLLIWGVYYLSQ